MLDTEPRSALSPSLTAPFPLPPPAPQVLSWPPFLHQADPVLSALRALFLQLAQHGAVDAAARRSVLDPAPLREALARTGRLGE